MFGTVGFAYSRLAIGTVLLEVATGDAIEAEEEVEDFILDDNVDMKDFFGLDSFATEGDLALPNREELLDLLAGVETGD